MYGSYHHVTVLGKENAPCEMTYDVTGGLCENNDKFAIDRQLPEINIGDLFSGFSSDFGQNFLIGLLTSIFTFLWGLLFVIPGIIKSYAYSLAYYIKADHPDYFESLSIQLPLVETKLPFYFEKVMKLPSGHRFYFKDPLKKNDYGQRGLQYTPLTGEDIGDTGYVVVSYNEKSEKRKIKSVGTEKALEKTVDVSTATIERKSDKRRFELLVGNRKHIAVDVQARLIYSRGESKEMKVVAGDTIDLNGSKYEIKSVEAVGNGAKVTVADKILGKIRVLEALEQ